MMKSELTQKHYDEIAIERKDGDELSVRFFVDGHSISDYCITLMQLKAAIKSLDMIGEEDTSDRLISLNKACEWIESEYENIGIRYIRGCSSSDEVENFKQAMEGGGE